MTEIEYQYFQGKFEGYGKLALFYQSWRPVFCERVMVIAHGMGEHSGRYMNLIRAFANEGIGFYAYDHRGHGRSKGARGCIKSFHELTEDLRNFLKLVSIHENHRPIVLFGHSLGGLISLHYIEEVERRGGVLPSGLILSNPMLKLAVEVPGWKKAASGFLSKFLPRLTLSTALDYSLLSRDPAVQENLKTDKLSHRRMSGRFYTEILHAMKSVDENKDLIRIPLLMLIGGSDQVIDPHASSKFVDEMEWEGREKKIYPDFYHELINDIGKEKVLADIKQWLKGLKEDTF